MKTCSKCKMEKDDTEFNKNTSAKDGLQRYCRECNKGYGRKYYQRNGETVKKQRAQTAKDKKLAKELEKIRGIENDNPEVPESSPEAA